MKATFVSQPLARREFLRISSTAVIGIAATGLINPKALLAATTAEAAAFQPLLSIGYAPTMTWGDGTMALTSADRNLTPDPLFLARGARVTVLGSNRSPNQKNAPGSLYLDAIFQANTGAASDNSRFGFWSVAGHSVRDSFSNKVSFFVPVMATTGLSLLARHGRPRVVSAPPSSEMPALEQDNTPFTLSLGGVPGPKLQAGVYVIALREAADEASAPNWDRLSITKDGGKVTIEGATFAYVILTVDYGDGSNSNKPSRRRIS
jgi:hypothetical protein